MADGNNGIMQEMMTAFWQQQMQEMESSNFDWKFHQLPLARIKKVMKSDDDVKMISAEAPIVFSKACEIFILELTMRAWINTEENKRRTLQKSDVAGAVGKADMYDFLIDIVPREEATKPASGPKNKVRYLYHSLSTLKHSTLTFNRDAAANIV
ncbi:Nuclear transcription factor Y subunit C-2 [Chytridiales sp. JEL 0842]|nr:Nuclear transcription factor Y subunit C-2 [Chytridiales sp. JEL 0842]